jgi:hypothetical protein
MQLLQIYIYSRHNGVTIENVDSIRSGGRDRTDDLRFMNHQLGKKVSNWFEGLQPRKIFLAFYILSHSLHFLIRHH